MRLSTTCALLLATAVSTGAVTAALAKHFQTKLVDEARAALEHKGAAYGRLMALQLAPAVASRSPELARPIFEAAAEDPELDSLVLMTATGATLHTHGAPRGWIEAAREGVEALTVIQLGERVAVVTPVSTGAAPHGTLIIELSARGLVTARAEIASRALQAGVAAFGLQALLLLAAYVATTQGSRTAALERAAAQLTPEPSFELRRLTLPRQVANSNATPPLRERA